MKLRSFHFSWTKAWSTNIHLLCSTVYLYSYRFQVRFPNLIASSMRVADSVSKMYAFSTYCTFSHEKHLLLFILHVFLYMFYYVSHTRQHEYSTKKMENMQVLFAFFLAELCDNDQIRRFFVNSAILRLIFPHLPTCSWTYPWNPVPCPKSS